MSEDEAAADAGHGGLIESLRRAASTAIELVHTRLELLVNELEEERLKLQQMLMFAALAAFCGAIAVLMLSLLIVVVFWDSYRIGALVLLTLVYFAAAVVAYRSFHKRAAERPKLFSASLAELAKDREWLNSR